MKIFSNLLFFYENLVILLKTKKMRGYKMKKVFKKISIFFILIILSILLIYVSDIDNLPDSIIIFEGETLKLKLKIQRSLTAQEL